MLYTPPLPRAWHPPFLPCRGLWRGIGSAGAAVGPSSMQPRSLLAADHLRHYGPRCSGVEAIRRRAAARSHDGKGRPTTAPQLRSGAILLPATLEPVLVLLPIGH